LIAARRATQSEVDPAREKRLQGPELLGDDQWRVIRKHDPAGAHPDRRCPSGDVSDDHGSRGAGDAGNVVMLRQPEPVESPFFGVPGEIQTIAERLAGISTGSDRREIQ
jgi:hypothetical protein